LKIKKKRVVSFLNALLMVVFACFGNIGNVSANVLETEPETKTVEIQPEEAESQEEVGTEDILGFPGFPLSSINVRPFNRALSGSGTIAVGASYKYNDYGLGTWGTAYFNYIEEDGTKHIAYCLEPKLASPVSSDYIYNEVTTNVGLAKALYYAHGGPGSIGEDSYIASLGLDGAAQYIISHCVVAYFYGDPDWNYGLNDAGIAYCNGFIDYINNALNVPDINLSFSTNILTAVSKGNYQETNQTTLNGDSRNYITVNLPTGVTLCNVTKGTTSIGNVKVFGGDTFYLTAGLDLASTQDAQWSSDDLYGSITTRFVPLIFNSPSGSQTLSSWTDIFDQRNSVSFSVKWLESGKIKIIKTSEDGIIAGLRFKITGNDVNETVTTGSDGTIEIDNLASGTYTITEVFTPDRYEQPETKTVTVEIGKTATVAFKNVLKRGDLTVTKNAEDGLVSGVNFHLYGTSLSGAAVDEYAMADSSGIAAFSNILISGKEKYTLEEVDAAIRYVIPDPQSVTINWNEVTKASVSNILKKWNVTVTKADSDTATAQGAAVIAGAVYGIYKDGKLVDEYMTDSNGQFTTDYYICGSGWTLKEITPSKGYLLDDKEYPIGAEPQNFVVELNPLAEGVTEDVIRGDLKGVKVSDGDLKRMAGVLFRITSVTTGESHIIVTDENGQFDTSSSWNLHSQDTNRGETAYDGIWFGDGEVNDDLGALIYDTYLIEELPSEANEGMAIFEPFQVNVSRNLVTVDLGTITNDHEPQPEIGTIATDKETGSHTGYISDTTTIVDVVDYINLTVGKEYTLKGILMDKETGEAYLDDGKEITVELTFTPEKANGSVEVEFTFNSTGLAGKEVVVFEYLYCDEKEVTTHVDIEDKGQAVTFPGPGIGTQAADKATGTNTGMLKEEIIIVDTVTYSGLIPGKEYTLKGILMDKETGEAYLDDAKEVTAEIAFTPDKAEGAVDLEFIIKNGDALRGKTVVVFEYLNYENVELATHADIEDKGQTVTFPEPEIGTTATDKADGDKEISAATNVTIVDTVSYSGLTPGKEYTLKGILMDKETGKELAVDGKTIVVETTFTPDKADGKVELEFSFDASSLVGKEIVVFEDIYYDSFLAATHADIEDKGQTVQIVKSEQVKTEQKTNATKTGDSINLLTIFALMVVGACGIGIVIYRRMKVK